MGLLALLDKQVVAARETIWPDFGENRVATRETKE